MKLKKIPIYDRLPKDEFKFKTDLEFGLILTKSYKGQNFKLIGSEKGIYIGSNGPQQTHRRLPHKNIKISLANIICEEARKSALEIGPGTEIYFLRSVFRGHWKISPDIATSNLVIINGGKVIFDRCEFLNSEIAVLIKANSEVEFNECKFKVCDTAIKLDASPNPRLNDSYWNGVGPVKAKIAYCHSFKINTFVNIGENCEVEIIQPPLNQDNLVFNDGGKYSIEL